MRAVALPAADLAFRRIYRAAAGGRQTKDRMRSATDEF
jgi:hypothetical protein